MMQSAFAQWEQENTGAFRSVFGGAWAAIRGPVRVALFGSTMFLLGVGAAVAPWSPIADVVVGRRLADAEAELKARRGELELVRLELARVSNVMGYSSKFRIPADLAASIYDIALAEGIDPELGFNLVRVESGFFQRAVSPKGAVGLAQLMPRTAFELDPTLGYSDLFDRDTNLRLGFRYLRQLLEKYEGDLHLALHAYNRGPGTVDRIVREGGDPSNGYARAVLGAN